MCKSHRNGENGKRRTNGTGTLEKRGDKWRARYYVVIDGLKVRKVAMVTPELVRNAISWNAERNQTARDYPASFTAEPLPIDAARLALAYLSGGNGVFTREAELKKNIAELEGVKAERAELERQQAIEAERARIEAAIPVAGAFKHFEKSDKRRDSGKRTLEGYRAQYTAFAEWVAAHYPKAVKLRDITPDIASAFMAHIRKTKSTSTHNKYLIFLRGFWKVLRKDKAALIAGNPWEDIHTLVVNDLVVHKELTIDELKRVAEAAGDLRPLFMLGIYTGLRLGDCCTLEWGNVDLARGFISVIPLKTKRIYNRQVIIPIHPVLRAALKAVPPASRKGYLLPELAVLYKRNSTLVTRLTQGVFKAAGINTGGKGGYLYLKQGTEKRTYRIRFDELDANGKHITIDTGTDNIDKARAILAEKVGTAERARAVVGFHSLRHTFSSILLNAGINPVQVDAMLCHNKSSMTMRYYHENASALSHAVNTLPDITGKCEKKPVELLTDATQPNTPAETPNTAGGVLDALHAMLDGLNASEHAKAIDLIAELITETK